MAEDLESIRLALIETLKKRVDNPVAGYGVSGRSVTKDPIRDLVDVAIKLTGVPKASSITTVVLEMEDSR